MALDFATVKTAKTHPALLIATPSSMTEEASQGSGVTRLQVVGEMLPALITHLSSLRTVGSGGIYTVTFADRKADAFGVLTEENIEQFWASRQWAGTPTIMPGYERIHAHYAKAAGAPDEKLLLVIPIDGELKDEHDFEQALARDTDSQYVVIALIGHGRDYQHALTTYKRIESRFPNIKVVEMGGVTNGTQVAETIMEMIS